MRHIIHFLMAAALMLVLSACASTASLRAAQPDTTLLIDGKSLSLPSAQRIRGTSFGNYEFKAETTSGRQPFYGLLPLQFKGGHLALDILFFAPAAFANLRGAYPFYEFDVEQQVIRFKRKESDHWREYRPTPPEAERARKRYESSMEVSANTVK